MSNAPTSNLPPILPVGTAVVTLHEIRDAEERVSHPKGSTGVLAGVPADPHGPYRVRFPAGDEARLLRWEFEVLARFVDPFSAIRSEGAGDAELREAVVFRCVVGSRAYGLARDGSDTDRRGAYLAPARLQWSIFEVPEQIEQTSTQECYWELGKLVRLALKGNPNVLEALWSPMIEHLDPVAEPFIAERRIFLSKFLFQTYNGFAISQHRQMTQDIRTHGSPKWKQAMHLVRLLRMGIAALDSGELSVLAGERRAELLAIRDGEVPWEELERLRVSLHQELEDALARSALPDQPDFARANELVVAARAESARRGGFR
ncbi:MAG: DNA polymerase beta superfamily protein [Planctomycetota bacterium]